MLIVFSIKLYRQSILIPVTETAAAEQLNPPKIIVVDIGPDTLFASGKIVRLVVSVCVAPSN